MFASKTCPYTCAPQRKPQQNDVRRGLPNNALTMCLPQHLVVKRLGLLKRLQARRQVADAGLSAGVGRG